MAFEIKSLADPFAIKIPWLGSPKEFPSFIQRSISKSSSHFCDIDLDDEDHEDIVILLDQGVFHNVQGTLSICLILNITGLVLATTRHSSYLNPTHCFARWIALALLWVSIILTISYDPKTKSYKKDISSSLIKWQEFRFTVTITFLIILPWVTVRRVPIKVFGLSGHTAIVKFDGGVKAGIFGRISPSPLSEWHTFGIISDGRKEHTMLASAVGDFTKSLVSNPPCHLWVRKVHFVGLPYLVNMVLLVATGSGISKGIEQNFGKEIKEMVSGWPKDKVVVHYTAVFGRPNVSQLSIDAARNWSTEVVIVISNPEGSRDVVNACKAAGISAFGQIWDS
ncbi:hypothetical protein RGQ29_020275 [Quercus rubra]|uniref:Uncharacterized protein n=1 Tax=Quercus rubra TaxID=3512 RepID=A0AAN7IXH4_QUERU|nr:hypothetical protein RGQ29_020275 [Quercus rubra]